jgi:hypothetical protein
VSIDDDDHGRADGSLSAARQADGHGHGHGKRIQLGAGLSCYASRSTRQLFILRSSLEEGMEPVSKSKIRGIWS